MKDYFNTIGDGLSQLLNAVLFNSGNANESLSGRCFRQRDHWFFGRLEVVINALFNWFGQEDHCERAYATDLNRALDLLTRHSINQMKEE